MRFATCLCVLIVAEVLVSSIDARKTFSSRRKSGGNNRRGGSTSFKHKPPPPPATPQKDTINTFLNSERVGSSHSSGSSNTNTHHRGNPFNNKPSAPEAPKNTVPQTNGPIGFEKYGNQGNQKLGFDKVNSEVQHKPVSSNVPSAPSYPGSPGNPPYPGSASYPGKPPVSAPNGPPPAYPGYGTAGTGTHGGSYEPPPAYPGRPVNAPPVYSANNPNYGQRNPAQPGYGSYPNQQGSYQQNSYPHQQGNFPGQNYPGQQNYGYSNAGGNFGSYPNQGYNQGFGSNPSGGFGGWNQGGFGQSYPGGHGGNSYGGSPFGQTNPYGGSPFGSPGFGGNSYGSSNNNPYYSPNNFGYSSNPGFFGSNHFSPGYSGGYNNYGYHKKSRFGGLPIPIPIPIPIPLGGFGGFGGGHSYNHRVLDSFVKNKTVSTSDNTTVFILNNSTVTPCTTDQFIYQSLNVTVLSCTAGNCTSIKIFATTNVSAEETVHSAGITICLENNTTYSSYADNINPTVSDLHKYFISGCKENENSTANVTASNVTAKATGTLSNETIISEANTTATPSETTTTTSVNMETTTLTPISETTTVIYSESNSTGLNSTVNNSTGTSNSSFCEILECYWLKMCLPSIEIVDRCDTPECPFTRTGYQPCVILRMCKSPSTPVSTFPSINTTISRIDQFNNITSVNDLANLTLVTYTPPRFPANNCSQNATDPACQPPPVSVPQDACVPSNSTETSVVGDSSTPSNTTVCVPPMKLENSNSTGVDTTTTEATSTTPVR